MKSKPTDLLTVLAILLMIYGLFLVFGCSTARAEDKHPAMLTGSAYGMMSGSVLSTPEYKRVSLGSWFTIERKDVVETPTTVSVTLARFDVPGLIKMTTRIKPRVTENADGSFTIDWPTVAVEETPVKKLFTDWVGHPMVSDNDRYTPSQGWLIKTEIGLRSDGVVVWRDVK